MKRKLSFSLICLLLITGSVFSQKKTVSNIVRIDANNIQPILKGDKIAGYYLYYRADKAQGGDYTYKLRILDENLEMLAENSMISSPYTFLLEAQYNGDVLCFKFFDREEKEIRYNFYNDKAEDVYSDYFPIEKNYEITMLAASVSQDGQAPTVTPIEGKGFVTSRVVKNKKYGYELTYYPNEEGGEKWTYGSKSTSPVMEIASIIEASEDVVVLSVILKKSLMSKKMEFQLIGLNAKTGEELFMDKLTGGKYEESITNTKYDPDTKELMLIGQYFKKGDNPISDRSLGIFVKTLELDGTEKDVKYTSWSRDLAKFLGSSHRSKLDEIGFIFFHDFIVKDDGSFYGVGESYRKTVSAGGTALKVLALASGSTGGSSAFQMTIGNFYIFEFDKDKNIIGVEVVEKSISREQLPAGAGMYGPQIIATMIKASGKFDYEYSKKINDGKTVAIFYKNYEKIKRAKNKSIAGVISNTDGKYMVDKIDIPTEADFVKVLPATGGNILFVEYFKKEKNLEFNFKKMNY